MFMRPSCDSNCGFTVSFGLDKGKFREAEMNRTILNYDYGQYEQNAKDQFKI